MAHERMKWTPARLLLTGAALPVIGFIGAILLAPIRALVLWPSLFTAACFWVVGIVSIGVRVGRSE